MAKEKFQPWELFLNLLKAFFFSCLQIRLEARAKRHSPFCQVLSSQTCLFFLGGQSAHTPANKAQLLYGDREAAGNILLCKSRDGKHLPSHAARFSRLWFAAAHRYVCSSQSDNTLRSWVHELRFPLRLRESHAAAGGRQPVKSVLPSAEYF